MTENGRSRKSSGGKKGNPRDAVELCLPFEQDDCHNRLDPAAGNRNGTEVNNRGSNGNYWSGELNTQNSNNAYELNFNSGNHDWNNNNRYNGNSVRAVTELAEAMGREASFRITREQLLCDLYVAYRDARRHKRRRPYQLQFELNLEENLVQLRDELYDRTYKPSPCECFIITSPKKREVFAAHFRDRVVHHLYFNYTYALFDSLFIDDSYSCRKGRGTHYGIARLAAYVREASAGYTRRCYVMKIDVKGYFMHIHRATLLEITLSLLLRQARATDPQGRQWRQALDYRLLGWLSATIIMSDPTTGCIKKGKPSDWDGLPPSKSLFSSPTGCGLPIGNLTSQLLSNIYLNELDQFMTGTLELSCYGRYVDDAYALARDKSTLRHAVRQADAFLQRTLRLKLNRQKTLIADVRNGVEFLGAFVKPYRNYISRQSLRRMAAKVRLLQQVNDPVRLMASVNSFLGVLSHYRTYNIRRRWFGSCPHFYDFGFFGRSFLTYGLKGVHDVGKPCL